MMTREMISRLLVQLTERHETAPEAVNLDSLAIEAITALRKKLQRIELHWSACVSEDSEEQTDWMAKMREILDSDPA